MSQKNFSFWFCTLLSGIVIGIASQRIPQAHAHPETQHPALSKKQNMVGYSLAYEGYNHSSWIEY